MNVNSFSERNHSKERKKKGGNHLKEREKKRGGGGNGGAGGVGGGDGIKKHPHQLCNHIAIIYVLLFRYTLGKAP